ncbi:hypothetical protein BROOK1789C_912 [Bathymodiolus brooksi thiotrophic gill symbiont]|nr:hypothetical protein BROOK1789B_1256 [Bathymodiolus brooksi thiotrophic gill symbiont]CAB9543395.1 hypothetical protein BROOK1789C_912 [Bathymodiolus brooksi thiotrophic gill symbiont]SHE20271.1 hypothetical protein BBROOKSOX_304 [Bathymodiolus brooksi thiotrophic gill symbiont]
MHALKHNSNKLYSKKSPVFTRFFSLLDLLNEQVGVFF